MKKLIIFICALIPTSSAFAYHDYSSYDRSSSGLETFINFIILAYIILSIIILIRWWKMTKDVKEIRQHITHANPKLTYLVATGETEQAQKAALTMLVDKLYPIYEDKFQPTKAYVMNGEIQMLLPKIQKLGITVPEYVTSGEKFIDYLNGLTGNNVPYEEQDKAYSLE